MWAKDTVNYSALYFKINTLNFFKDGETSTNELHFYFWLYNFKSTQDTIKVASCPTGNNCDGYMGFSPDFSGVSISIDGKSLQEVKIVIKSNTATTYNVKVNSFDTVTIDKTDSTLKIYSNASNIGATNFRFYISK
jgi:hypothetical protein